MDADRIDDVTEWDEEPFADGFAGLRKLANRTFSGAVTTGTVWLFMLNGRIVGVIDGELDAFAGADGTAYEAPHDSLPLLFAMQELGGDVRAQYYTNDTPLSKADQTLTAGNFTGYVELSENVLSGDYYVAYYGGESLSCAFVGNSRTLKTGDDAFSLADDEVGIYRVYDVDLDVRDVPAPDDATTSGSTAGGGATDTDRDGSEANQDGSEADRDASEADRDASEADRDASEVDRDRSETEPGDAQADWNATEADRNATEADPGANGVGTGTRADPGANGSDAVADVGDGAARSEADDAPEDSSAVTDTEPEDAANGETGEDSVKPIQEAPEAEPSETADNRDQLSGPTGSPHVDPAEPGDQEDDPAADDSGTAAAVNGGVGTANASDASSPDHDDEDVFSEEEQWREARSIPALDPNSSAEGTPSDRKRAQEKRKSARSKRDAQPAEHTRDGSRSESSGGTATQRSTDGSTADSTSADDSSGDRSADGSSQGKSTSQDTAARREAVNERPAVKQSQLQRKVNRLEASLQETQSEREQVATERDEHRERAEKLESRVAELETELERVRSDLQEAQSQLPDGEQMMTPAEALGGTNLFIRYGSQGGATLEKAAAGKIDREELIQNLRIEHHTSFEDSDVVVDGQPYTAFLRETMEYGFTEWLVQDLLFEIQDTNNESLLQELYDAISAIDRAEIGGSVSIRLQENGEETREQRTFDLVLRDRMGTPLFVADLNDSRDPTPEGTLESLVQDASHIAETDDAFAAGFAVTSSFFEPGALETAADATGGGLLSRSKKKSYVKISRKQGYHLCLAESRDGGFHLTVPEL